MSDTNQAENVVTETVSDETSLARFERNYILGEKSDLGLHEALIQSFVEFIKGDRNTMPITAIVRFIASRPKETARGIAIIKYIERIGNFRIIEVDGNPVVKVVRKFDYNQDWLRSCKETTWADVQKSLVEAKPFKDTSEQYAANLATGVLMGAIDEQEVLDIISNLSDLVGKKMNDEKITKKAADRAAKLLEQGDLVLAA